MRTLLVTLFAALLLGGVACAQDGAPALQEGSLVRLSQPVPALTGEPSHWLNTGGKPIPFQKGKVYVVHFWTFGCINCKRNLPHYAKWQKQFARENVAFIGVHTPETDDEKRFENVRAAVRREGITYPVLFDPAGDNWRRWQQVYWPTVYLIDKRGRVRYYWFGELEWEGAGGEAKMRGFLQELLNEPA